TGVLNDLPAIDTCAMAIEMGATFVARSFSGDKKQLMTMLKAAISHNGTVMIDVISPCVTFNDHEGSTKSYKYVQDHDEPVSEAGFVPHFADISVDYDAGSTFDVRMHDGSRLRLRKLHEDYDPTNKVNAVKGLMEPQPGGDVLNEFSYTPTPTPIFVNLLNKTEPPRAHLTEESVRPPKQALEEIMESLR